MTFFFFVNKTTMGWSLKLVQNILLLYQKHSQCEWPISKYISLLSITKVQVNKITEYEIQIQI